MKYSLIALAVIGTMMASVANAEVKISGRINPVFFAEKYNHKEVHSTKGTVYADETYDRPEFTANSRLRFSGKEPINKDWTFLYSAEYNLYLDMDKNEDRGQTQFTARSTYLGVESKKYGRFRFGRQTVPGEDIDMATVSPGDAFGTSDPFAMSFDNRTNNSFQYASPYFGRGNANRIKFQYGMDEGDDSKAYEILTYDKDIEKVAYKKRDIGYISFLHSDDKFSYGAFYAQAGKDLKALRGTVRYELPRQKMGFGATVQHTDYNAPNNELGVMLGGNYYYNDNLTFALQAGRSNNYKAVKDATKTVTSFGVTHFQKLNSGSLSKYLVLSYGNVDSYTYDTKHRKISDDTKSTAVEIGAIFAF